MCGNWLLDKGTGCSQKHVDMKSDSDNGTCRATIAGISIMVSAETERKRRQMALFFLYLIMAEEDKHGCRDMCLRRAAECKLTNIVRQMFESVHIIKRRAAEERRVAVTAAPKQREPAAHRPNATAERRADPTRKQAGTISFDELRAMAIKEARRKVNEANEKDIQEQWDRMDKEKRGHPSLAGGRQLTMEEFAASPEAKAQAPDEEGMRMLWQYIATPRFYHAIKPAPLQPPPKAAPRGKERNSNVGATSVQAVESDSDNQARGPQGQDQTACTVESIQAIRDPAVRLRAASALHARLLLENAEETAKKTEDTAIEIQKHHKATEAILKGLEGARQALQTRPEVKRAPR